LWEEKGRRKKTREEQVGGALAKMGVCIALVSLTISSLSL
jgi:hypothetical protein